MDTPSLLPLTLILLVVVVGVGVAVKHWLLARRRSLTFAKQIAECRAAMSTVALGAEQKTSSYSEPVSIPSIDPDVRLLRHLSDGTAEGFSDQVQLYLTAFNADRLLAHSILESGDRKKMHRIAHHLVAHAGAVNAVVLIELATTLQAEAAFLPPREMSLLLQKIDREFFELRNKLESLRAWTEHG
jgi:hypothetical protein